MTQLKPRIGRILSMGIGLFALWQIFFLPLANLIQLVPLRPAPEDLNPNIRPFQSYGTFTDREPVQRAAELAGKVLDSWGEMSGQEQGWKLFTPGVPPHSLFPAIELRFPDGEVAEMRSRYEPTDLDNPSPRLPLVHDRFFNFQAGLTSTAYYADRESVVRHPDLWSRALPRSAAHNHRAIVAWLKWNAEQYRAAHPDRPFPSELILKHRYIPSPEPGQPHGWTEPAYERPYARWIPGASVEPGILPVEGYDPVARRFAKLRAEADR